MRRILQHTAATAIVLTAALLASCRNNQEDGKYTSFGPEGWAYADTVVLVSADSTVAAVDLAVAIRNSNDYEYSNVWVEATYWDADTLHRDTANIRVADVYGRWLGTGVGVGFQNTDTIVRGRQIDLNKPVLLRHIMRADTLHGIEQAGLIVIKK